VKCKREYCGDGIIQTGLREECDAGASNRDCVPDQCDTACKIAVFAPSPSGCEVTCETKAGGTDIGKKAIGPPGTPGVYLRSGGVCIANSCEDCECGALGDTCPSYLIK
jgi:hypothetical protein